MVIYNFLFSVRNVAKLVAASMQTLERYKTTKKWLSELVAMHMQAERANLRGYSHWSEALYIAV